MMLAVKIPTNDRINFFIEIRCRFEVEGLLFQFLF
ncbi:hypothetical protein Runsl_0468 [Runella slithyformis DSM 19594]|uniref:Uncharacterized protein n=1 Tax=Runella slithyformis (strain ATCC 29530 / DSM 19594 / LMG 11500 / NCIMB 11436 / LSU 4) TaxID=761193 RepID=A0A7U3ZGQ8_RUNSL|nr:hypothetical protein Runsl_0468 [Runella slithyformis DSM 19594]